MAIGAGAGGGSGIQFGAQAAAQQLKQKQLAQRQAMQQLEQQQGQATVAHQQQQTQQITPNVGIASVNLSGPNVTQGAYEGYQGNQQQYDLQGQAEARRLRMLQPLMNKYSSNSSSSSSSGGGPAVPQVNLGAIGASEDAARSAELARTHDTAGQTGRAAMNALSDEMGSRGLTGGGLHMGDAAGIISEGARGVGEATRTQQINALDNARSRASEAYQGGIVQRGQDMDQSRFNSSLRESSAGRNQQALQQLISQLTARY